MNLYQSMQLGNFPLVTKSRRKLDLSNTRVTTFNVGDAVPCYVNEIYPGDTVDMRTGLVIRSSTPLMPWMDNADIELDFFFVPTRLLWSNWEKFNGASASEWDQKIKHQIPQLKAPAEGWKKGGVADHFGLPINVGQIEISALYFRAYVKIWNDWYRNQNVQKESYFNKDNDTLEMGSNGNDYVTDPHRGGILLPVNKWPDYFTSCLPSPQKGDPITITTSLAHIPIKLPAGEYIQVASNMLAAYDQQNPSPWGGAGLADGQHNITTHISSGMGVQVMSPGIDGADAAGNQARINWFGGHIRQDELNDSGIYADASQSKTAISINDLRKSFALQTLLENDAKGGTRYIEIIKAHFGVDSPDARLQRSECLGGSRIPMQNHQVVQMATSENKTPLGYTGSFTHTTDTGTKWIKSFTEHGILIGIVSVRTNQTYESGINKMFTRKDREDFYFPELQGLGEEPVKMKELYATGTPQDEEVFGFMPPYSDLKYKQNDITGEMRSKYSKPLNYYHFGNDFKAKPTLSDGFIRQGKTEFDRTLAVKAETQDQIQANFYFETTYTRVMNRYDVSDQLYNPGA